MSESFVCEKCEMNEYFGRFRILSPQIFFTGLVSIQLLMLCVVFFKYLVSLHVRKPMTTKSEVFVEFHL